MLFKIFSLTVWLCIYQITMISAQTFTIQSDISFTGVYAGESEWGDFDNDGDLDVVITGYTNGAVYTKIYRNDGNNQFLEITNPGLINVGASSVDLGDFDNDGNLDIFLTGTSNSRKFVKLYRNLGNFSFTEYDKIKLLDNYNVECSTTWGDYDNDGDLDIFISNYYPDIGYGTKIYRNNLPDSAGFSEQKDIFLSGTYNGKFEWGDYDNDGDLDILFNGYSGVGLVTKIFKNNLPLSLGFTRMDNIWFIGLGSGSWSDFDNDGDLDILLTGSNSIDYTKIFRNDGNDTFNELTSVTLPGLNNGMGSWCDYDGDGDLDLFLIGISGYYGIAKKFQNNGNQNFVDLIDNSIPMFSYANIKWADYDNDGDLDFLITGTSNGYHSNLYSNNLNYKNIPPSPPDGIEQTVSGSDVILRWNPVKTDKTPFKAITYNVRMGTSAGASNICSPNSASNGFRKMVDIGNAQMDTFFILRNLKMGTYYWSVQAIDNNFAGGTFSQESSFNINTIKQARDLTVKNISTQSATLKWVRGSGDKCAVFIKECANGQFSPENSKTYFPNDTIYKGNPVSGNWYCIYNGVNDSVKVNNLKPHTYYSVNIFEYNGNPGSEIYNTQIFTTNTVFFESGIFAENNRFQESVTYPAHFSLGDLDNDGDLDVLQTGDRTTRIFRNNAPDSAGFTELKDVKIPMVNYGTGLWADYDQDGFLDFFIAGYSESEIIAKIYHSNKGLSFTEMSDIKIKGVWKCAAAWGDYDNDGDLDLLISGDQGYYSNFSPITKIYKNNGPYAAGFTEQKQIQLLGLANSSVAWGDYDNDGFLDIILCGQSADYINSITNTVIYHNNGNGTFSECKNIKLPGVEKGSVSWGDYDNDGDLDILLTGSGFSKVFRNDYPRSPYFSEATSVNLKGVFLSTSNWGDLDNDGDLDIVISGARGEYPDFNPYTAVFLNNLPQKTGFTEQVNNPFAQVYSSSMTLGDYQNDGDLDLFLSGTRETDKFIIQLYENKLLQSNKPPQKPAFLSSEVINNNVVLKWNAVRNDSTNRKSISYNIRLGTQSGGSDICDPMSNSNGFRKVVGMGNCQLDTFSVLKNLKPGKYFWSVQAIDNNFDGSEFSIEDTFEISTPFPAKDAYSAFIDGSSAIVKWTRGLGDGCVVFIKKDTIGIPLPENQHHYFSKDSIDASCMTSNGWYCVYNGTGNQTRIFNLDPLSIYKTIIFEYYGNIGNEVYNSQADTANTVIFKTGLFAEQTEIPIAGIDYGNTAWVDYNNDGYLDLFLNGRNMSENETSILYKNNGNNSFSAQNDIIISQFDYSSSAWGDYDKDGDFDLLIVGSAYYGDFYYYTKIFRNQGNNKFEEQKEIKLCGLSHGSAVWNDLDNDGFLDIIVNGGRNFYSNYIDSTLIYHNNGNNTFTLKKPSVFKGTSDGKVIVDDFNNDGYNDLLVTGWTQLHNQNTFDGIFKMYRNDRNLDYSVIPGQDSTGKRNFLDFTYGDFDKDGDLDLIFTGENSGYPDYIPYTRMGYNNGNFNFSLHEIDSIKKIEGNRIFSTDLNNDGYMDLLIIGYTDSLYYSVNSTKVFLNTGGKNPQFIEQKSVVLPGVSWGYAAFGDYDNDGDNDLVLNGTFKLNYPVTKIFRNELYRNRKSIPNHYPGKPSGLQSKTDGDKVILSWNKSSDIETPSDALTYQIRIGSTPGGTDVVFPNSLSDGTRLIPCMGNTQTDTFYILSNIKYPTYYWSVQAIDQSYSGSPWASEEQFVSKVGIDIKKSVDFKIYATGNTVTIETDQKEYSVEVYDLLGIKIFSMDTVYSGLYTFRIQRTGCYIVRTQNKDRIKTTKIWISN